MEEALLRVAAIEVGQPSGVRLFALQRNQTTADQVSQLQTLARDMVMNDTHGSFAVSF